jgi:hypothetical protein
MSSPYNPDTMRARFKELGEKADKIRASSPRIERDRRIDELTDKQQREFAARIKEHEKELYDIDRERAVIARALGGKTGE